MTKKISNPLMQRKQGPQEIEQDLRKHLSESAAGYFYTPNQVDAFLAEAMKGITLVKRRKHEYAYNVPAAFDIETTSFYRESDNGPEKQATMYIWMFGINGLVIIGRTWDEFHQVIDATVKTLNLSKDVQLYVYVHNLAFELGFIQHQFKWADQFSLAARRPVIFTTDTGISFRCSLVLSGYSLNAVGKTLTKYKINKLVGDLDYSLMRNSETTLSPTEMQYCINDVLVVMAYIQEHIENDGNIVKILRTKTSYVRKLMQKNCLYGDSKSHNNKVDNGVNKTYGTYKRIMAQQTLTVPIYKQARRGFAGGFTHGDNMIVGKEIPEADSADLTSAYPTQIVVNKFPSFHGQDYEPKDYDDFLRCLDNYCCLFDVEFKNIYATFHYDHYISRSKCWELSGEMVDNGRIVEASHLMTTVTETDFKIIMKTYDWSEFTIYGFRRFIKRYLPTPFVKTVLDLYGKKTTLKGLKSDDGSVEKDYQVSKENLNSCYGMMVTDICKPLVKLTETDWVAEPVEIEDAIEHYNTSESRCVNYLWGIWVTSYNRKVLWDAIMELKGDYLYSDTDSVKFTNYPKHKVFFEHYNKYIAEMLDNACLYHGFDPELTRPKNSKGVPKQLGVWDMEEHMKRFKTLGAKRYLYEDMDGNLHLTVAGLGKNNAIRYLQKTYGDNDNIFKHFDDNLTIPAEYLDEDETLSGTGKMTHTYIEYEYSGRMTDYQGHNAEYHELSGVHLEGADYSLSLAAEFKRYLEHIQIKRK